VKTVPYSETKGEHQYPVQAISAWQEWNDLGDSDWFTSAEERDMERCEKQERVIREHIILLSLVDYSCQ